MLRSHPDPGPHRRSGFSLLEVTVVMVILTVAVGLLSSTMSSTSRVGPMLSEEALAAEAARFQFETIRTVDFEAIFATYNSDPTDDPGGNGTAPGASFAVAGLDPQEGDADGFVGRIHFPEQDGRLAEDCQYTRLGLPRDLDGDGVVDSADHSDNYTILPIELVIQWNGSVGNRQLRFQTAMVSQ
ncbi:type IV pilus modification PilV family protein [Engelhardtia mirabilis]|uniref:Prepilin-type N-terminal cleavage/methylation domain-containing protein n=1 Tax=Engelhardtia mirabilis TaxID=2528011 RepID=A0A518BEV6_9BACT|nr:hypothetical protein Pla133_05850 [Planctomycetes bacterium Pla133]QDU99846.1 hypothetical protein Pla86_05850 [Planctomycetes bacterium Pla86]